MNLDDLSDFLLVATHGGYTQAARESGRPKASLSRRVMGLETALGVRLFERGARTTRLTEEGALLFDRASGPLRELAEAADLLRDGRAQPRGLLRVSVPTLLGHLMMGRIAAQFAMAWPEVRLSVTTEDRQVDLIGEGYDLVVRVNPEPNSELVGRCFARDHVLVVSVPRLKERFFGMAPEPGPPVPVIARGPTRDTDTWRIVGPPAREIATRTVLELPVFTMVRDAALTGLGAARLPRVVVADDLAAGRLVSWGAATDRPSELWALHTSRRLPSAKVKAFMAFLEAEFQKAWRGQAAPGERAGGDERL